MEEGAEGTITELQYLEKEVSGLKEQLDGVKGAETMSSASASVVESVKKLEEQDGFIVAQGETDPNPFHASAGGPSEGGCCVIAWAYKAIAGTRTNDDKSLRAAPRWLLLRISGTRRLFKVRRRELLLVE